MRKGLGDRNGMAKMEELEIVSSNLKAYGDRVGGKVKRDGE